MKAEVLVRCDMRKPWSDDEFVTGIGLAVMTEPGRWGSVAVWLQLTWARVGPKVEKNDERQVK